MANPSKRKGTSGEVRAVAWLQRWWRSCERRALAGILDRGDVAATPYVVSVKNTERWMPQKWLRELETMRTNCGEPRPPGFVMARYSRSPWYFLVPEDVMRQLLDAIHGAPEQIVELTPQGVEVVSREAGV